MKRPIVRVTAILGAATVLGGCSAPPTRAAKANQPVVGGPMEV